MMWVEPAMDTRCEGGVQTNQWGGASLVVKYERLFGLGTQLFYPS